MQRVARAVFALVSVFILTVSIEPALAADGCNLESRTDTKPNLKQAAKATGVLSKMMHATRLVGLDNPDIDVGPLTLLAPSDAAFDALPAEIRDRLLAPENRAHLTDLLLYHAVPGLYPTDRLLKARVRTYTISAIDGSEILIQKSRKTGEIAVAGAKIISADVTATDGIIHIIDKVLIPPHVLEALTSPEPRMEVAAEGDQ